MRAPAVPPALADRPRAECSRAARAALALAARRARRPRRAPGAPGDAARPDDALADGAALAGLAPWRWTLASDRVETSGAWHTLLGGAAHAAPERSAQLLAHVHDADRERVAVALGTSAATGATFDAVYRLRAWPADDAAPRWVHDRARVVRDAAGRPAAMHGVTQDVTARQLAEVALAEARAALAARATHDESTGLHVWRGARPIVAHALRVARRRGGHDAFVAVAVEVRAGPDAGPPDATAREAALREAAHLVRTTVRETDVAMRLDEALLAAYAHGMTNACDGERLVARLQAALDTHTAQAAAAGRDWTLHWRALVIPVGPADDPETLRRRAAEAMRGVQVASSE